MTELQHFSKDQRIKKEDDSALEKNQHGDQGEGILSCHHLCDALPKPYLCFLNHLVVGPGLNLTSVLFLVTKSHHHLRSLWRFDFGGWSLSTLGVWMARVYRD